MRRAFRPRRRGAAAVLGLVMAGLLSSNTLAFTWLSDTAVTHSGNGYAYPGGLAVTSTTVAHTIYVDTILGNNIVEYRRTTNGGTSWTNPIPLSSPFVNDAGVPTIDAYGNSVDAVWVEGDSIISGSDAAVVFRHSADAGATWGAPVHLSPLFESPGFPRVAQSGSTVVVVWTEEISGRVYVRVSTNNGSTFNNRIQLGTTTDKPYTGLNEGYPVIGFGSGLIVVGYYTATHTLQIRRSTNGGASWATAQTIATNAAGDWPASVAATGSTVLVGYAIKTSTDEWTVFRRSINKGGTFASAVALSPSTSYPSFQPVLTFRSGAFRAAFERCTSNTCAASATLYRGSTTGATWGTAITASVRKRTYESPADIDVTTKVLVLYDDSNSSTSDAYIRRGG
jgi:hypothetical protein